MYLTEDLFEQWKQQFNAELRASQKRAALLARLCGRGCVRTELEAMLWLTVHDAPSRTDRERRRKDRRRRLGQLACLLEDGAARARSLWLTAIAADLDRHASKLKAYREGEQALPRQVHDHPAVYLCGYVISRTGTKRFCDVAELLDLAFAAAGKNTPTWVDEQALRKRIQYVRASSPELWRQATARKS